MALERLDTLGSTYDRINGGIHQRAASIVGVPSIVRHLGFWSTTSDQPKRRGEFVGYLDDLRAIVEAKGDGTIEFDEQDLPEPSPAEDVRGGTIRVIRFWWYGMRARLRIEFRTEYVTITSILDLSLRPHAGYKPPPDAVDHLAETEQKLERLGQLFRDGVAMPDETMQSEYFELARFFQYRLWKSFEETVLDASMNQRAILGTRFGQVFADFRGIVTGSELTLTPKLKKPCAAQSLRPAFERDRNQHRNREIQHALPDKRWAEDSLRRLWPLIEAHEYLRESEFTVSCFLGGRALFVTALGPKLPEDIESGWPWTPVCNFIHSHTDDEWQLGRLIDRIKNLGTLRLAGSMEFERLVGAGEQVDTLMNEARTASEAIQKSIKRKMDQGRKTADAGAADSASPRAGSSTAGSAGNPPADPDSAMDQVRRIHADLNEPFDRDIYYRLERAEHYVDQFMTGAAALRVKRIEGFQKYDEMVARRMSGLFGYVRLLRSRMADVDSQMSALSRAYTSLKAVETTDDIRSLVGSMEGLVGSMERQDRQIEQIQEFGEVALIGFLIPYYLGAALFHYAFHVEGPRATLYWQLILSFFALIVIARSVLRIRREYADRERADGGPQHSDGGMAENTAAVFLLYLALIWLVVPSFLHGADDAGTSGQARTSSTSPPPATRQKH